MGSENYVHYKLGEFKYGSSPYYFSPEILKKKFHVKSDIWSVGVILHILLSGYPPFMGSNNKTILSKIQNGKYTFKSVEWK